MHERTQQKFVKKLFLGRKRDWSWRWYKFVAVAVEIIVAGTISMHLLPIVPFNDVLLTIVVFVFVGDGEGEGSF